MLGYNQSAYRLWTGKDPVTGDKANRWLAFGGLAFDGVGYLFPIAKLGKVGKGGKVAATAARMIDTVDDVSDATTAYRASKGLKAADTVDDVSDISRVYTKVNLRNIADDVAESLSGSVSNLKNGYKVEVPNGNKPIIIRIMDQGSGGRTAPYFRVSIDGKGSLDLNGNLSSLRQFTHIDISDGSADQIVHIIKKI
nr:pre-toxin TG domain-containing protein [Streptococcus cuniculi]